MTRRRKGLAQFKPYAKAVAGFITPGIIGFAGAITTGSDGGSHVTSNEWSAIILAMIATGGAVFATRNSGGSEPN